MKTGSRLTAYLIHDVAKELRRHFEGESQRLDLTLMQWRAIAHLSRTDGISQVSLAGLCETDAVTIGGVLERLETKGLTQRLPNPEDSRAKIVRITDKGGELVVKMDALANEIFDRVFDGISNDDQDVMRRVLERVRSNLSAERVS